jgi:hypothetical protein
MYEFMSGCVGFNVILKFTFRGDLRTVNTVTDFLPVTLLFSCAWMVFYLVTCIYATSGQHQQLVLVLHGCHKSFFTHFSHMKCR